MRLKPPERRRKTLRKPLLATTYCSALGEMLRGRFSEITSSNTLRHRLGTAAIFLAVFVFSYLVFDRAFDSGRIPFPDYLVPATHIFPSSLNDSIPDSADTSLETVLKEASIEDKTVILTTLNEAWTDQKNSILDLFLESFRIGYHTSKLLKHLVIIALDQKAFVSCKRVHSHCFALTTEGVDFSQEAYFMTPDYLKMMWRRIDFLRSVLEMGYNFLFTDADVMWFRDPFPHFYPDADIQIACDHFSGNSTDVESNRPNGGFNFVRSNDRSIEFYKYWYSSREYYPGLHDQDVLNNIKFDAFLIDIDLQLRFLDTAYFGGFCEPSKDLNKVCTMHANCCVGLENKVHDLRIMLQDWKNFMSLPPSMKISLRPTWRPPMNCSLALQRHFAVPENGTRDESDTES